MATARDGSPVELYLRLGPLGEADLIHASVPAGAEILELGCGTGRVTHALIALRHRVVVVDESPEMLAHVVGAERVRRRIESLRLGRRFAAVVLASNLLNTPGRKRREMLLRVCERHLADDGALLCQRTPADWEPPPGPTELGGVTFSLRDVRRSGRVVSAVAVYEADGLRWEHRYRADLVPDSELEDELRACGLRLDRWLDDRHAWLSARRLGRNTSPAAGPPHR